MANDKKAAAAGPREQTYPLTHGNIVKFYVQGSDNDIGTTGAFADVAQAIQDAQHFIFVADWSFQPLFRILSRGGAGSLADTVGVQLLEAAKKPGMLVAIHTWDHTGLTTPVASIGAPDNQNDDGDDVLDAIAAAIKFPNNKRPANMLWRMSSRTGVGFSHHQKFVVMDADGGNGRRVIKAFFGGLDLTKGRFDFQESPFVPPPATQPFGLRISAGGAASDDWYNPEFGDQIAMPRQSWQDFYANIVGPSAWDVVREFVGRWNRLSGSLNPFTLGNGDISQAQRKQVIDKFLSLFDKAKFVQDAEPHGGPFTARVVRSMVRQDWGRLLNTDTAPNSDLVTESTTLDGKKRTEFEWVVNGNFERSIAVSYEHAIRNADRFIYIETQYLIGSGDRWKPQPRATVANQIPALVVDKIKQRIELDRDFHAYLVIPMFPEGNPLGSVAPAQRSFEFKTMRFMAQAVFEAANAKNKDWRDFLSFYFLARWTPLNPPLVVRAAGSRRARVLSNRRYQLYVHSKLMIVDDQFAILGSANLNERSLAGNRDSEICLSLRADEGKLGEVRQVIGDLRRATWDRHLEGITIPDRDTPEKPSCSRAMRAAGITNWQDMAQGLRPNKSHLIHIPFFANKDQFFVEPRSRTQPLRDQDRFIFDAEASSAGPPANGTISDGLWEWGNESIPVLQRPATGAAE
jgi:phospholipase D1/2